MYKLVISLMVTDSAYEAKKMTRTISTPTRVTVTSQTCIDNIIVNNMVTDSAYEAKNVKSDLSDHYAQLLKFHGQINGDKVPVEFHRHFHDSNIQRFRQGLENLDWNVVYQANNCNDALNLFLQTLSWQFPLRKRSKKHIPKYVFPS
ncbi:hypothetical protein JTB14_007125 [Gonioctena quinquepunctata]|nr:hypothetical protein JTB14_007125 [Gonioctena quinquepunctata]